MFYAALVLFTAAIVAVDQLTKYLAAANLAGRTITLIPGWLQLHYITNDGMALSLLRGARWLFVVMTVVYLAIVILVVAKKWLKKKPELGQDSQCLHARELTFVHPRSGERVTVSCGLPEYFTQLLQKLRGRTA